MLNAPLGAQPFYPRRFSEALLLKKRILPGIGSLISRQSTASKVVTSRLFPTEMSPTAIKLPSTGHKMRLRGLRFLSLAFPGSRTSCSLPGRRLFAGLSPSSPGWRSMGSVSPASRRGSLLRVRREDLEGGTWRTSATRLLPLGRPQSRL
jgi:hypothetical protein